MIEAVTVTNPAGEQLRMVLADPDKSGLNITNITGIGPGEATINVNDIATTDGAVFNSARIGSRNIVFFIKFTWSPTIEDARHRSYKFFPIKRQIYMLFETTNRTIAISGYVESNEPAIFEREEYAQISIVCPFPYFNSEYTQSALFYEVEQLFEFPFSNESLTEKLLIMGEYRGEFVINIPYYGDAPAGLLITAHANGPASNLMIYKIGTNEQIRIDSEKLIAITGSDIIAEDQIIISTEMGNKSIFLVRGGIYTNILNTLDRDVDWPVLTTGDNLFAYTASAGQGNIVLEISYRTLYEGV